MKIHNYETKEVNDENVDKLRIGDHGKVTINTGITEIEAQDSVTILVNADVKRIEAGENLRVIRNGADVKRIEADSIAENTSIDDSVLG